MSPFDKIVSRLNNVRAARALHGERRVLACCPSHADHHPSLDVRELADQRILLVCRAGCGWQEIVSSLGLESVDLFPKNLRIAPVGRKGVSRRAAAMRPLVSANEVAEAALLVLLCLNLIAEGRTAGKETRLKLAKIFGRLSDAEVVVR